MINILDRQNSILNHYIAQLRDQQIQTDPMRFRLNLERVGSFIACEISRTLNYHPTEVTTPLGESLINLPTDKIVLATILRAGIPMHNGFLEVFDYAENAFVSAYRHWSKDGSMTIVVEQTTTPDLEDKTLILIDPMLATGGSIETAYHTLLEKGGRPRHTHIASVIASTEGVEYIQKNLPMDQITIWSAALDSDMTVKSYIVPGIGDPGDLAYGKKL